MTFEQTVLTIVAYRIIEITLNHVILNHVIKKWFK